MPSLVKIGQEVQTLRRIVAKEAKFLSLANGNTTKHNIM
jgi:hypothetical protein